VSQRSVNRATRICPALSTAAATCAHGLIRGWRARHAAAHDGARLAEVLDSGNTASEVWADTPGTARIWAWRYLPHGIRDKVAASRKRGIWMGGFIPDFPDDFEFFGPNRHKYRMFPMY